MHAFLSKPKDRDRNATVIASNRRASADCVTARPPCVMLNTPPATANYVADRLVRKMKIRKARTVAAIILSFGLRSFSTRFRFFYSNTCAHLVRERRHSIIRRLHPPISGLATTVPPIYPSGYCRPHRAALITPGCQPRQSLGVRMIASGCGPTYSYSALGSSSSSMSPGSELYGAVISLTAFSISAATSVLSFRKLFEFSRPCPNRVSP